jgi:hypothetical protein
MRKLTEEEADNIPTKKMGKQSAARVILSNMKVGEIILFEKSDWKQKYNSPFKLILNIRKTTDTDFSCAATLDGSGWIIKRLK